MPPADAQPESATGSAPGLVCTAVLVQLVFCGFPFLAAGRVDYVNGWLFMALNLLGLAASWPQLRRQRELMQERMRPGPNAKIWDKVIVTALTALSVATLLVAGFDAGRFHWLPPVPGLGVAVGAALYALGMVLGAWARAKNPFFSSVVRIQEDRGHVVCRAGPYRAIRHPGYAGGLLAFGGLPFLLGSFVAVVPAVAIGLLLILRTALEDATLRRELSGYADYARAVRYRLLPGVW